MIKTRCDSNNPNSAYKEARYSFSSQIEKMNIDEETIISFDSDETMVQTPETAIVAPLIPTTDSIDDSEFIPLPELTKDILLVIGAVLLCFAILAIFLSFRRQRILAKVHRANEHEMLRASSSVTLFDQKDD